MRAFADAIVVLWGWRRFAVAFGAGAVSAFAFAPFNVFPLLLLTAPVFVLLIDGAEPAHEAPWYARLLPAASVGFGFGFGFFVAGLWWIGAAFLVDAGAFAWALPLAVVALPAALALFWAAGAALARLFWREDWTRLAVFAAAMTSAEWLRGHLFTGFPWNAFGYALTPTPVMMQSAALVGIWGLTLVAFFVFAAPVVLLDRDIAPAVRHRVLAAAGLLLVLHVGFGALRLTGGPDATVPDVHLRIVQPAIPQDEHWQASRAGEMVERYLDLSRGGAPEMTGVTHLFWPESAFPFILTDRPEVLGARSPRCCRRARRSSPARRAPNAAPASRRRSIIRSTPSTTPARSAPPTTRCTWCRSANTCRSAGCSAASASASSPASPMASPPAPGAAPSPSPARRRPRR